MEVTDRLAATDGAGQTIQPRHRAPVVPRGAHLRRSLVLITWGWIFGAVWMTATTGAPLTLFAQHLRASPFQFGLLSAMPFLASLVSMPASLLIDATGQRKRIFLWALYGQRFLWFVIAIVPVVMIGQFGPDASARAMLVFLLLMFVMHCGQAIGGPAWVSWMAVRRWPVQPRRRVAVIDHAPGEEQRRESRSHPTLHARESGSHGRSDPGRRESAEDHGRIFAVHADRARRGVTPGSFRNPRHCRSHSCPSSTMSAS